MNVQKRTTSGTRDEEIVELLREVNRTLRERLMRAASGTHRSLASLSLLRGLDREPGITLSELARRRYMPKSLVSILIGELSEDGLVRKGGDPADQRLVRLSLTSAGKKELERWRTTYRSIAADAVGRMEPADADALLAGIRALRDALAPAGAIR